MSMEPMTLGSPVSSPTSPPSFYQLQGSGMQTQGGSQVQHHNGFLPGYLMGDYSQQGSGLLMSPTKMNRSVTAVSPATSVATPKPPTGGFLTPNLRTPSSEKPAGGGPPVTGLFSTPKRLHSRLAGTPGSMTPLGVTPIGGPSTPMPNTPQLSFGGTPGFNASKIVDHSQRETDSSTWVTVFGFPPSAASYILSQFSQCGTILQHQMTTNGNWMQIKFQTRMQAQKALGRSGRVFGGTLMIGVLPSADPTAAETSHFDSSVFGGLTNPPAPYSESMVDTSVQNMNTTKSIRPLTQAYKSAQNELDVSTVSNAPNRNEGIVSKAMEYIFGW